MAGKRPILDKLFPSSERTQARSQVGEPFSDDEWDQILDSFEEIMTEVFQRDGMTLSDVSDDLDRYRKLYR